MMDCEVFEEQQEAYLANALSPDEQSEFEQHQVSCSKCKASMERAMQVEKLLRRGLPAAVAMMPTEQISLRENVLYQIKTRRPTYQHRWVARLVAVATIVAVVTAAILLVPWGHGPGHVSAAEIITRSQAAMTDYTGLNGILHLKATIEQWEPGAADIRAHGVELWFDFDNPVRYRIQYTFNDEVLWAESRTIQDDTGYFWKYSVYPESSAVRTTLSIKEIQQLASWYNPALFRDELPQLAQTVSDIELVEETTVAGRQAHVLRGKILSLGTLGYEDTLELAPSVVTVTVDAETYWLLGWEETVAGESRPRIIYRVDQFELLSQSEVPESTFALPPPEGAVFQEADGLEGLHGTLPYSPMSLEEVSEGARFTLLIPANPPEGIAVPHYVSLRSLPHLLGSQEFACIYRGSDGRWMALHEHTESFGPGFTARHLELDGREGWIRHDPIYADAFTIYLLHWDTTPGAAGSKPMPGTIILEVKGYSVNEAKDVLDSLEPYQP